MTWLTPKQAAREMSDRAFHERYRSVVKPLGGDEEVDPELCDFNLQDGRYILPNGDRGTMHFVEREVGQ